MENRNVRESRNSRKTTSCPNERFQRFFRKTNWRRFLFVAVLISTIAHTANWMICGEEFFLGTQTLSEKSLSQALMKTQHLNSSNEKKTFSAGWRLLFRSWGSCLLFIFLAEIFFLQIFNWVFVFFLLCVELKLKLKKLDAGRRLASASDENFLLADRSTRNKTKAFFWMCEKCFAIYFCVFCIFDVELAEKMIKYIRSF